MEALFSYVDELAARHGALVVDLYGAGCSAIRGCGTWTGSTLTAEGHRRVAEAVWRALGLAPEEDWRAPLAPRCGRRGWSGGWATCGSRASTWGRGSGGG